MLYRALFLILVLSQLGVSAQLKLSKNKLENVPGVAYGGPSDTPEMVKTKAINDAKINALKKAGIEENINSYSNLFRSETEDNMEEMFTSDILSNINGTVKDTEVVTANMSATPEGQIKYDVIINCTVIKYKTKSDPGFDAWIEGIQPVYKAGEGVSFTVKPTRDCYIRAFWFTDDSFVLLPNEYEESSLLYAQTTHKFPNPNLIESYETTLEKPGLKRELNRLVIVLLKEDLYYTGNINYKEITDWIMSIPPDERHIKNFAFDVYQ